MKGQLRWLGRRDGALTRAGRGVVYPWPCLMTGLEPSGMGAGLFSPWEGVSEMILGGLPPSRVLWGESCLPICAQQRAREKGWLMSCSRTGLVPT